MFVKNSGLICFQQFYICKIEFKVKNPPQFLSIYLVNTWKIRVMSWTITTCNELVNTQELQMKY